MNATGTKRPYIQWGRGGDIIARAGRGGRDSDTRHNTDLVQVFTVQYVGKVCFTAHNCMYDIRGIG